VILVDTQVLLWMTLERSKLSKPAAKAMRSAMRSGAGIAIADKTLWEVAMAFDRGRLNLPWPLGQYLRHLESLCAVVPIDSRVAERAMKFSTMFPSDPNDRIIAATALVHTMTLVTADEKILGSGEVPCVW
jgi:PIN domain nuclease of toxin-antitoxin system